MRRPSPAIWPQQRGWLFVGGRKPPSPPMSASGRIRELARASRPLSTAEVEEAVRIGELTEDVLRDACHRLLRRSGTRPVLYQYQGDGTPQLVRRRTVASVGPHRRLVREGGSGTEFLCQIAFFLTESQIGEPIAQVLLSEPRVMGGKTSWHLHTARREFWPWLRKSG